MHFADTGLLLSARAHGEHGAVVRILTREHGVVPAYVHGGRSRRSRAVLAPGNLLHGQFDARREGALAQVRLELLRSRAGIAIDPFPLACLNWMTAVLAAILPESDPHPALYDRAAAFTELLDAGGAALVTARRLADLEFALLSGLGFRLDLSACAATGAQDDLVYVSPKSGRAVSRAGAAGYETRLFPLPAYLTDPAITVKGDDVKAALALSRRFLLRDLAPDFRREDLARLRDQIDARLLRLL